MTEWQYDIQRLNSMDDAQLKCLLREQAGISPVQSQSELILAIKSTSYCILEADGTWLTPHGCCYIGSALLPPFAAHYRA
jgi:hypothetical protein